MKLKKIVEIKGTIECVTGLSIKGYNSDLNIGGADSEVIKNPLTGEPYIPGSSIKGKMRSQLEKKYGMKDRNDKPVSDKPCGCGKITCKTCKVFGAHMNPSAASAPTRIIVRDAILSNETREDIKNMSLESGNFLEVKPENIIKRNLGTAESPRFLERVPAGSLFDFSIILQIFDKDNEDELVKFVEEGLKLIEKSYLGGNGSRGYGEVFIDYTVESGEI